jgi:hypothetical protein
MTNPLQEAMLGAINAYFSNHRDGTENRHWSGPGGCAHEYLAAEGVYVASPEQCAALDELRTQCAALDGLRTRLSLSAPFSLSSPTGLMKAASAVLSLGLPQPVAMSDEEIAWSNQGIGWSLHLSSLRSVHPPGSQEHAAELGAAAREIFQGAQQAPVVADPSQPEPSREGAVAAASSGGERPPAVAGRKVVQIAMQAEQGVGVHHSCLCDDGTHWYLQAGRWVQFPPIPQEPAP